MVRWNGANRTTTPVVSGGGLTTALDAQISAADIASAGTALVTVNSPEAGGGTSVAANFVIGQGGGGSQPLGIDVHGAQGVIGWAAVHTAGKTFAFLKATEGTTFIDTDFTAATHNIDNALANNLLIGAYHFALPLNHPGVQGAIAEAQHFLDIAGPYIGTGFLPPVLDIEDHPYPEEFPGDPCLVYDHGVPVGVDLVCKLEKSQLSAWVRAWVQKIYDTTGVRPIVYMNRYYATQGMENDLNVNPLWIATNEKDPQGDPGYLGPWTTWTFQQYDWNGRVPGVGNGVVDVLMDSFNGDLAGLQALANITIPTVTTPTITPTGGSFNGSVQVALACVTSGATIRYTTDGNDPIGSSLAYSAPFALTYSAMVKAKAFASGYANSATASASFTIIPLAITGIGGGLVQPPNSGTFQVEVHSSQAQVTVQVSDDMVHWTDLNTVNIVNGKAVLLDGNAGAHTERFYRLKP